MNRFKLLLITLVIVSCNQKEEKSVHTEVKADNKKLIELHDADQLDRNSGKDAALVRERDTQRRERVYEMLDSNLVVTGKDYYNAAMIFQHGLDSNSSKMAVMMMKKAVELDSSVNKWLLAAAIDRDLMYRGKPQIYGTQYNILADQSWVLYKIDTTQITDKERIAHGVLTLAGIREQERNYNKKSLNILLDEGKSIDDIVEFVKNSDLQQSDYKLSESNINSFGYQLLNIGKEHDALKVFKMNTELYPEGFNTYDSYGECLVKMGKIEEGIEAYKKSLELNPDNEGAKKVIEELGK